THPCVIGGLMDPTQDTDADRESQDEAAEGSKEQLRAQNRELRRRERVREIADVFQLGDTFAQRHINAGSNHREALPQPQQQLAKREPVIDGRLTPGADYDSGPARFERMAEALAARIRGAEPPEPARAFARTRFVDVAHAALSRQQALGLDPRYDGNRIVGLSLTNSDFPNILANVLNKTLMPMYESQPRVFTLIAQRRDFRDFRAHKFIRAGDFPVPLQVGEGGEITQGA